MARLSSPGRLVKCQDCIPGIGEMSSVKVNCMRLSMPCLSMGWNFGQQCQFTPTFNNNKKAHIICFIQCVSDLQSCLFVVVTTSPIDTALSSFMVWWNKEGFKQLKGVTWPRYVRASCAFNQASSPKWSVRIWMCDLRPLHRVLNWKVFFYINICCFITKLIRQWLYGKTGAPKEFQRIHVVYNTSGITFCFSFIL